MSIQGTHLCVWECGSGGSEYEGYGSGVGECEECI